MDKIDSIEPQLSIMKVYPFSSLKHLKQNKLWSVLGFFIFYIMHEIFCQKKKSRSQPRWKTWDSLEAC